MPREQVAEALGEQPVLSAEPTEDGPGGCDYYAMRGRPLANVWAYCFDEQGRVSVGVTQFSPQQPPPPEDASAGRAALIGRGDTICQSDYGRLRQITQAVGRTLRALDRDETEANRRAAGDEIAKFVASLERTRTQLASFDAPEDGLADFEAYLGALGSQIEVLGEAGKALVDGDDGRYDALGDEFNVLAKAAQAEAREYGFATCSASTFA